MTHPLTDRDLPAPWGLCDACGEVAGLPGLGVYARERLCPACLTRNTLRDAAQDQLEALTAPVIGAWAAQWLRAGLTVQQLEEITERASGAGMHDRAAQAFRTATLRRLARLHRPPAFQRARPDRAAFEVSTWPRLTAYRPHAQGQPWGHFVDGEGKTHSMGPGLDALTLTLPDGERALIFTGRGGKLDFERVTRGHPPGFRVPAALWPIVQAAMSGPDTELPAFAVFADPRGGRP